MPPLQGAAPQAREEARGAPRRDLRRCVLLGLVGPVTFAVTAFVAHYVLTMGAYVAPRVPVVVVIDCRANEDLCSAALSAAAVSAGDADQR